MIRLSKILVPTDFSDFSRFGLDYALALAARFEAELHLLNVVEDPTIFVPDPTMLGVAAVAIPPGELEKDALTKLATLPGDLDNGHSIQRIVRHGSPFVEIVRYARDSSADLIVMGTHGRTGLNHILLGSVAERVVRKAPCPVLTVRPQEHQFVMP